jgi:alpha-tubulin suppressor-like RCC1 family protein
MAGVAYADDADDCIPEPMECVAYDGEADLLFMPPIMPEPENLGVFNPYLDPEVHICLFNQDLGECSETIAIFTMHTGPGHETIRVYPCADPPHYIMQWNTAEYVEVGNIYSIMIVLDGEVVGSVKVQVVGSGGEMQNVDTGEYVPLVDGRDLPIKFRLEANGSGAGDLPSVDVGARHTCTLEVDGQVYCAGNNYVGQLGDGSYTSTNRPVPVQSDIPFEELVTGADHNCALAEDGQAYCWGSNTYGQLGIGFIGENEPAPVPVMGGHVFTSLAAGYAHTCGLTAAGEALCWGTNHNGQLGIGEYAAASSIPVPVDGGLVFTELTAGARHTCGLTEANEAWCWGFNARGALGTGIYSYLELSPVPVSGGLTFAKLTAGFDYTCGLTPAGAGFCWGANAYGQLGTGNFVSVDEPAPVLGGMTLIAIDGGDFHTCALDSQYNAWCWGKNMYGELGDGTPISEPPYGESVPVEPEGTYCQVAASTMHTCAVTPEGLFYCWGHNGHGLFGNGTFISSSVPVEGMYIW